MVGLAAHGMAHVLPQRGGQDVPVQSDVDANELAKRDDGLFAGLGVHYGGGPRRLLEEPRIVGNRGVVVGGESRKIVGPRGRQEGSATASESESAWTSLRWDEDVLDSGSMMK